MRRRCSGWLALEEPRRRRCLGSCTSLAKRPPDAERAVSRMMNASEREHGLVAHTQPYRRAAHTPHSVPTETAGAIPGRSNKPHPHGRLGGGERGAGSSEGAAGRGARWT